MDKEKMNKEMKQAVSMNEVIEVLNTYYDLDQKLGTMSKVAIVMGVDKVIKIANIKER